MIEWFRRKNNSTSNSHKNNDREKSLSQSDSSLSENDYEFLFDQLLEGVSHGWHEKKIIKFFEHLGDRGEQDKWVEWLKNFENKAKMAPHDTQRQLGGVMIRLGELTRSNPQLDKFGSTSYQMGRELFFGDIENLIWEYDGVDTKGELPKQNDNPEIVFSPESEQTLSSIENSEESLEPNNDFFPENKEFEFILDSSIEEITDDITGINVIEPIEGVIFQEDSNHSELEINPILTPELPTAETIQFDLSDSNEINIPESSTQNLDITREIETSVEEKSLLSSEELEEIVQTQLNQQQDRINNLKWQEFVSLLEENEDISAQIAQKLNISSNQPKDIARAIFEQLNTSQEQNSPELVQNWFGLGLKQASAGDFYGAIASWDKAIELDPRLSEIWHNRGSAYGRLSRYREAIESFNHAIEINPQNYQAWNDRAHALYQLEKWEEAVASWQQAIAITPDNHQFWYNLGCAFEQLGRFNQSIASYEKALEIKPDFSMARSRYLNLIAGK